jgi:hypothetical protein
LRTIASEIEIAGTPAEVWGVLTNFEQYPRWNPFIKEIEGELREGATIRIALQPPGGKEMTFRPRLLTVVPGRELKWLGKLLFGGIFDGEHHFWIDPMKDGVIFHQNEIFRGVLVPFTSSLLERTSQAFDLMNRAIKREAESRPGGAGDALS